MEDNAPEDKADDTPKAGSESEGPAKSVEEVEEPKTQKDNVPKGEPPAVRKEGLEKLADTDKIESTTPRQHPDDQIGNRPKSGEDARQEEKKGAQGNMYPKKGGSVH